MALISTVLGTKKKVSFLQNGNVILTLDASISEGHNRESPPTEHPVESGTSISDHIVIKPYTLEIKGIKSDSPIDLKGAALTTAVGAITPSVTGFAAVTASSLSSAINNDNTPSKTAYQELIRVQENRLPLTVVTTLTQYENMYIKSLKVPRDASTGQVLYFEISLVQLILVKPFDVDIKTFKNGLVSAPENDQGSSYLSDLEAKSETAQINGIKKSLGIFGKFAP